MSTGLLFATGDDYLKNLQFLGTPSVDLVFTITTKKEEIEASLSSIIEKYKDKVAKYNHSDKALAMFEKYKKKTLEEAEKIFQEYVKCVIQQSSTDPTDFLNNWFLEHMNYPFPSATEKKFISQISGLTGKQITNWFINNRGRSWKPVIDTDKDQQKVYEVNFENGVVLSKE